MAQRNGETATNGPYAETGRSLSANTAGSDRSRHYVGTPPLPSRPALSAPVPDSGTMAPPPQQAQPRVGLAGLTFLAPLFFVLAFAAGGAEKSLQVLGPLSTFALPVVAVVAFWWEDWPGSSLRAGWSGLTDTLIVMACALGFTLVGQAVIANFDVEAVFNANPGTGHVDTFPHTLPLAAGVFTAILQLTLVTEGWPFRRLGRVLSGLAALAASWGIAVAAYLILVGLDTPPTGGLRDPGGPVSPPAYGAWLTALGAWQVVFFVGLRGWPFKAIRSKAIRLPVANAVVIACAWISYLILRHPLDWPAGKITAVAGCSIAALLLVAMLFEAWPWINLRPLPGRTGVVITSIVVTGLLYWALDAYAQSVHWGRSHPEDWIAYGALNVISLGVILHVAIWKRWPAVVDAAPQQPVHTDGLSRGDGPRQRSGEEADTESSEE